MIFKFHLHFGSVKCADAVGNGFDPFAYMTVDFLFVERDPAAQCAGAGDRGVHQCPAVDGAGDHQIGTRAADGGFDRFQPHSDFGKNIHRVDTAFRIDLMSAFARYMDDKASTARHYSAVIIADISEITGGVDVESPHRFQAFQCLRRDEFRRTVRCSFLRRLKEETHIFLRSEFGKKHCRTKIYHDMSIVSARVHQSFGQRLIAVGIEFFNGERVNIAAQSDGAGCRIFSRQFCHHSGLAGDLSDHHIRDRGKNFFDFRRGPEFLKTQFRVSVKFSAQFAQSFFQCLCFFENILCRVLHGITCIFYLMGIALCFL